jgi:3-deoxy-7-phosphoheptulonate synthase / chorismate mutase
VTAPKDSAPPTQLIAATGCKPIAKLRANLDQINVQLLTLIEARGRLVREVMAIKRSLGAPAYDPKREQEMMEALLDHANDVYPKAALERIFRAIFAASRALGDNAPGRR